MRISYFILLFAFVSAKAVAQQTETRQVGSFEAIKAQEGVDVYLKKGDKESARIEVTGTDLGNVLTEITGSTLKIHLRDQNLIGRKTIKVYVTYVKLKRISASSAANVFSDGPIKSDNFDVNISSAASVEVSIEAESVIIDASSAGNAVIEGKTKSLEVEVSSAGDIDAYRLESETVHVRTSSAGSAKVNASKELEAHASSGGSIRYRGNPTKTNLDSSSGGSVKKTS